MEAGCNNRATAGRSRRGEDLQGRVGVDGGGEEDGEAVEGGVDEGGGGGVGGEEGGARLQEGGDEGGGLTVST